MPFSIFRLWLTADNSNHRKQNCGWGRNYCIQRRRVIRIQLITYMSQGWPTLLKWWLAERVVIKTSR